MGVPKDQAIPQSLGFLDDQEALLKSVEQYLEQSQEYQKWVDAYQQGTKDSKPPKPGDVLVAKLLEAFPLWRIADDRLTVTLAVPTEPYWTNGEWDPEDKRVRWTRSLLTSESELTEFPPLCYAIWTEPDAKTQTERFGKVVLENRALADYCLWHRGLSEAEAQEWETFLKSLKPGKDLVPRLQSFRFSQEPANLQIRKDLAKEPRELILEGLGASID
jgi:hypothetical protein